MRETMNENWSFPARFWLIAAFIVSLAFNFISLSVVSAHVLAPGHAHSEAPDEAIVETRSEDAFAVPLPSPMPIFSPY